MLKLIVEPDSTGLSTSRPAASAVSPGFVFQDSSSAQTVVSSGISWIDIKNLNAGQILSLSNVLIGLPSAAGGSTTQFQYNSTSVLAGATNLVYLGTGQVSVHNTSGAASGWLSAYESSTIGSGRTALYSQLAITGGTTSNKLNYAQNNYITGTNPASAFTTVGNGIYMQTDYGRTSAGVVTSATHGTWTQMGINLNIYGQDDQNSEYDGLFIKVEQDIGTGYTQAVGPAGGVFGGIDINVASPIAVQPGLLDGGGIFVLNNYNGSPSRSGQLSGGLWIYTSGALSVFDALHNAATSYPVDVGLGIMGTATGGSGQGFNYGVKVGGKSGPFGGTITSSKIGIGLDLSDYVTYGLYFHGRFSGATGPAIAVDSDAGDVAIGLTAPAAKLHVASTYTTANQYMTLVAGTLNSSNTSIQAAFNVATSINPSGASLSNAYGAIVAPTISGSSLTISQAFGLSTSLNTGAGFSGSVTTAAAYQSGDPTISGPHFASYTQYLGQPIASNGNGKTSGTWENNGFRIAAFTAASGAGGTVNNNAAKFAKPSANTTGSNNKALYLTGTASASASSDYALYSDSTAGSSMLGSIVFGANAAASADALVTLTSTTQGLLLPRMTTTQRDAISSPTAGLLIYNTTTGKLNIRVAAAWEAVTSA